MIFLFFLMQIYEKQKYQQNIFLFFRKGFVLKNVKYLIYKYLHNDRFIHNKQVVHKKRHNKEKNV